MNSSLTQFWSRQSNKLVQEPGTIGNWNTSELKSYVQEAISELRWK